MILPDLDIGSDAEVWEALGRAGVPSEEGGAPRVVIGPVRPVRCSGRRQPKR